MTATQPSTGMQDLTLERLKSLSKPALWVLAARMRTLGLSLTPVAAGSWVAAQAVGWRIEVTAAAMGSAALIQIGTNLWNDAADAASGVDGPDRLGPPRMTALGLLDAVQVRRAALGSFMISAILGLYLATFGGWPIIALGLVSLALGYLYSMGPFPLSGTPLGEALVIGFFGIAAVVGTAYLHGVPPNGDTVSLGLLMGLPAAAILMLNNHRDRMTDAKAGRRTLAILIGEGASKVVYAGMLIAALVGGAIWARSTGVALLALLPAAGLAAMLVRRMFNLPVSAALNDLIARTAGFQVLLLAGLWYTRALGG